MHANLVDSFYLGMHSLCYVPQLCPMLQLRSMSEAHHHTVLMLEALGCAFKGLRSLSEEDRRNKRIANDEYSHLAILEETS